MKNDINIEIEIPEDVKISIDKPMVKVEGPKGTIERKLKNPRLEMKVEDSKVTISSKNSTKIEKMTSNTFAAHIKNMITGVKEGHNYKLKVCSSHFPMNVAVSNNEIIIKNYLGEAYPRTVKIKEGADVKVNGEEILVESIDIEVAGQVAADIENATKVAGKDRRIFQDGIFITEKRGRSV